MGEGRKFIVGGRVEKSLFGWAPRLRPIILLSLACHMLLRWHLAQLILRT
jgi:hypothetical protein